jgi:hypothetical protein
MRKRPKAKKQKTRSGPLLNLTGVKFEDAVQKMLNAPPMEKAHK